MQKNNYQVKLDNFEGPMDLLLYLIKREEMNIYDIPIARITRQYMEFIELIELLDISLASDFILMASILMQIKSKMLLPIEAVNMEEELADDPRSQLMQSLVEYKKFKELASELEKKSYTQEDIFTRFIPDEFTEVAKDSVSEPENEDGFIEATLFDLLTAFKEAMNNISAKDIQEIAAEEFSVEDKIKEIKNKLNSNDGFYFSELMADCRTKLEIIVTFIAILELIKQQQIQIRQSELFGEIKVCHFRSSDSQEEAGIIKEEVLV